MNYSKGGCFLQYGRYGIRALKAVRLTYEQLEASRRLIARKVKKKARIWIRVFPNVPVTEKPKEVRMGKGKGSVGFWVDRISSGKILFEISNVPERIAREVFATVAKKLPIPTVFVKKVRPILR